MSPEFWIILIASLASTSCALVGCFLVLRQMSMLGDAISHAVLPGIVLAFLLTGDRSALPMVLGAGAFGLLTAIITDALHRHGKLQEDASIGVTFTWLFAIGIILISALASHIDLDQDCVLYGEIAFAPWDTLTFGQSNLGPRAVWILGGVTILNLTFIGFGLDRLKLTSFDPVLAASLGIQVGLWHYLLMGFVSLTTVAAFESVGAIVVVALLVIPANAAYLLAKSTTEMLLIAVAIGIASSVGGYYLAAWYDASIAAAIAMISGAIFLLIIFIVYGPWKKSWAKACLPEPHSSTMAAR